MKPEEREYLLDNAALDMSKFMLHLTLKYKGLERDIALFLARQLGAYVAIAGKKPKEALEAVAKVVRDFDYSSARAHHFGYKIGADETQKPSLVVVQPEANIMTSEFGGQRNDE